MIAKWAQEDVETLDNLLNNNNNNNNNNKYRFCDSCVGSEENFSEWSKAK